VIKKQPAPVALVTYCALAFLQHQQLRYYLSLVLAWIPLLLVQAPALTTTRRANR